MGNSDRVNYKKITNKKKVIGIKKLIKRQKNID